MFSKSRFYSYDRTSLPEEDVWNINIDRNSRVDHSAAFPVELAKRCIETGSPPGGWILDPFCGSGTVVDVAQRLQRHSIGIDLSKEYNESVAAHLLALGNVEVSWDRIERAWLEEPFGWKEWRGNMRNFRKPGSTMIVRELASEGSYV
jgi:site-specific DNA-methyltransferase (adenine-specific)